MSNRRHCIMLTAFLSAMAMVVPLAPGQVVLYVDDDAPDGGSGAGWTTAFNDLQDALDMAASSGEDVELWVASGKYTPDRGTGGVTISYELQNGVTLYGGFAGSETQREQRDPTTNPTILSGDLLDNDGPDFTNAYDNSYHVVTAHNTDSTAAIDGFIIQGGNAREMGGDNALGGGIFIRNGSPRLQACRLVQNQAMFGGGLYCEQGSPILSNCTFEENNALTVAGGLYANVDSHPLVLRCLFNANKAGMQGGALVNAEYCNTTVINCTFVGNIAQAYGGGGVLINRSSPRFTNCVFSGNVSQGSSYGGGAIRNESASPILTNCTIYGNTANAGGGICNFGASDPELVNCILWANTDGSGAGEDAQISGGSGTPSINHCCLQGWTGILGGFANFDSDPLFVDPDGLDDILGTIDDLMRVDNCGSPCVNVGDNAALPPDDLDLDNDGDYAEPIPFDRIDNPRLADAIVDVGARETTESEYSPADANCDGFVNALDIDPFVLALTNPTAWQMQYTCDLYCVNDVNSDGSIDALDIDVFVSHLAGGYP